MLRYVKDLAIYGSKSFVALLKPLANSSRKKAFISLSINLGFMSNLYLRCQERRVSELGNCPFSRRSFVTSTEWSQLSWASKASFSHACKLLNHSSISSLLASTGGVLT